MNLDDVRKEVPVTFGERDRLWDDETIREIVETGYGGLYVYLAVLVSRGRTDLADLWRGLAELDHETYQDLNRRFMAANPQINWES